MIGVIMGFIGSWMSGLGTLLMADEEGDTYPLYCDNAPTVRALDSAFPGFITDNHCVDNSAVEGKKINYSTDGFMLVGFDVVEED